MADIGIFSKGHVLLVRDKPSEAGPHAVWLTSAGFQVTEASGVLQALERIEDGEVDVVLTEVTIPGDDGLALLRSIRERSLDVPVVLMLDKPNNRTSIQATELGAVHSLVGPIEPDILEETATYAVQLSRARRPPRIPSRGIQRGESSSVSATVAKNEFGRVLDLVTQGGRVFITKHDSPKAVLLSVREFEALSGATEKRLDDLRQEFDYLLAQMQTPQARLAMQSAFEASPEELGKAAVDAAARERG